MGKRLGLIVVLLALVVQAMPARALSPPVARALQVSHWVHAAYSRTNPRFVDDRGRTVILRGVNVNGLGEYYQEYPELPTTVPLTRDDFAQIAANGFNVVRLIISWSRLEPQPNVLNRAYIEQIAEAVEWARLNDIYVLLDMHQDGWGIGVNTKDGAHCPPPSERSVGWDGAPLWATTKIGGDLGDCHVNARDIAVNVELSFTRLYTNAGGLLDHFLRVWSHVANRFRGASNVVGYDVLNEPDPGVTPGVTDYALLGNFYRRAINAIRSVDAKHTIFIEPSVLLRPLALPGPLPGFSRDRNLAYAPHLYNESIVIIPGSIGDGFDNARRASRLYGGLPIFSGEWGWFGNSAADQEPITRYAMEEDAHRISGTWWQWKQACGDPHAASREGARPPCAGKSIYSDGFVTRSAANRAVLTRSYVRAAPGELTGMQSVGRNGLYVRGIGAKAGDIADLWVNGRRVFVTISHNGPYELAIQ